MLSKTAFSDLIDRYYPSLRELLGSLLEAAILMTESSCGNMRISYLSAQGPSSIAVGADRDVPLCQAAATPAWPWSSLKVPIQYRNATIGALELTSNSKDRYLDEEIGAARLIARAAAHQTKRHEISQLVKSRLGKDSLLIGMSEPMVKIDEFIERVSGTRLPVLISGEHGCEKEVVAYALHFGADPDRSFIEFDCAALDASTFKSELLSSIQSADGGTIFFNSIDSLERNQQLCLLRALEFSIGRDARIITSTSGELDEVELYRPLLDRLSFLHLRVAPLRERRQDIRPLLEHFLRKYSGQRVPAVSEDAMEFFRSYEWPGNASELERVAARMAIMLDGEEITLEAIYDHVPALAGARPLRSVARNHNPLELAQELLDGEPSSLNSIHPGLQKALRYMAAHFKEDISLNQLARQACVSASHLSYLFRNTIGISFKNFLATLRIESAKRLLAKDKSLNVTEVAARVGFSDLRHFRRTFNRLANCNPKEYRRRVGQCP